MAKDSVLADLGAKGADGGAARELTEAVDRYRIDRAPVCLADHDPADTGPFTTRDRGLARALLHAHTAWLTGRQRALAAQGQWAVLLVLQGRDAAGKDSLIRHVMSGMNPQGCDVTSFDVPNAEELRHDFLWRYHRHLPTQGKVGVFNRSHYEEVLVVRVRPEHLRSQHLHPSLIGPDVWDRRLRDIATFEDYLTRNGTAVVKIFLNVSKEEQKERFLRRLRDPAKHFKFSPSDIRDREHWDAYTQAYEAALGATSTPHAPWYVVPADRKWYARLVVASILVHAIAELDLERPAPLLADPETLRAARAALEDA